MLSELSFLFAIGIVRTVVAFVVAATVRNNVAYGEVQQKRYHHATCRYDKCGGVLAGKRSQLVDCQRNDVCHNDLEKCRSQTVFPVSLFG